MGLVARIVQKGARVSGRSQRVVLLLHALFEESSGRALHMVLQVDESSRRDIR